MSEETKAAKAKPEEIKVKLSDGREATFVGKRNINKDYTTNVEAGSVTATFDFRTGDTLSLTVDDLPMILELAGHGLIQKAGDEAAGVKDAAGNPDVPSMVLAVDSVLTRLADVSKTIKERWFAEVAAGDGFSGASVVIRAIMEASGKDQTFVKAFLEKKLAEGKDSGLTRQKMYQAYRRSEKIGAIIKRLEDEAAKASTPAIDADAQLAELTAA